MFFIVSFEVICLISHIFLLIFYLFKKPQSTSNRQNNNRLRTSTLSSFTSFRLPTNNSNNNNNNNNNNSSTDTSSMYTDTNISSFGLASCCYSLKYSNNKFLRICLNFKSFLVVLTIFLFLIHFFLNKIIFNTNFYHMESIPMIKHNKTADINHHIRDQYYDTDGVVDIVLFTLIFYSFDILKPIFVFLLSGLLVIMQCAFIIVHSTSDGLAASKPHIYDFQNFFQVGKLILFDFSNSIMLMSIFKF
jgi:hypothetical protein